MRFNSLELGVGIPMLAVGIVLWRRRWWPRPESWW